MLHGVAPQTGSSRGPALWVVHETGSAGITNVSGASRTSEACRRPVGDLTDGWNHRMMSQHRSTGHLRKGRSMTSSDSFVIVVGVDGSEQSLAALDWAVTEARLRHGEIRLVTAWYYPPVASAVGYGVIDDTFRNDADQELAKALKAVADQGVAVTGQVVENSPATALLDAAKDADLLIVGSRGHGGFAGLLLGSVSSQVIHHARCPVLVVRPKAS